MTELVAFMDILGTKQMVRKNEFNDFVALDFSNPVGIVAQDCPQLRCAVFSDSVIVSAPEQCAEQFLQGLSFINAQWRADFIFSRGGVAIGDVRWVDHGIDAEFRHVPNLSFGRVYGQALVDAHEIESKSGPGAVMFLSREASKFFRDSAPRCVFNAPTDVLQLFDERATKWLATVHTDFVTTWAARASDEALRQHGASKWYFDQMVAAGQFMPDDYSSRLFTQPAESS